MLSFGLIYTSNITSAGTPAEAKPSAWVKTERPVQKNLVETLIAYGTLQSNPTSLYSISLAQAGQIAQLNVSVGQHVRKGTSLAVIKPDPQLLMMTTQARSAVVLAQGERTRIASLLAVHLATQSQMATAEKNLIDAKATLQAALQQGGGQSTQILRAPADALVTNINNQAGERPAAGAVIMQLSKVMPMQAVIGIAPNMISKLRTGMKVMITPVFGANIFEKNIGQKTEQTRPNPNAFSGVIIHTNGVINKQTGQIDIPIKLTSPLAKQQPSGLPIKVMIPLSNEKSWVVPRNAVLKDAQGSYIYQVSHKLAVRVPVKIGTQTNQFTAISGAINPQLNIVVLGNYTLQDGMMVREQVQ
ncbi:efflux RND transporter periplasmic adaptor subunit [Acinetobacter terrae]|uniref:efflux RND transporter periplasmic adaptor subunit n=1 Tax=Acinetobacter terrae TaxID=2731247 RepID=UPI0007D7FACC|nr:efflux RND transporter periplasmic adaptor subunit [Acinetobacter terrae]OAL82106.1 hypothetical protein AY608_15755 [Acinetobacter terrae]